MTPDARPCWPTTSSSRSRRGWQLITATLVGIALIVVLITVVKLNPFLALILGALTVGRRRRARTSPTSSPRSPPGSGPPPPASGSLIALGAMFAKLLADSGGADQIVDTIVGRASRADAAVGDGRGRGDHRAADVLRDRPGAADAGHLPGRPAGAGLADHRRHPGAGRPLGDARLRAAAPRPGHRDRATCDADLGVTLALGLLVAIPTIIVAGPLFGSHRRPLGRGRAARPRTTPRADREPVPEDRRPSFARHDRDRPAAGRADARQGGRRHRHRRPRGQRPEGLRRDRRTRSSRC